MDEGQEGRGSEGERELKKREKNWNGQREGWREGGRERRMEGEKDGGREGIEGEGEELV